jgi:formate hydrogenlyase transcriptional activator
VSDAPEVASPLALETSGGPLPLGTPAPNTPLTLDPRPVCSTMDAVERAHILSVLEKTRWRMSGAAGAGAVLGLHPNTLRHRMKKLGIAR